MVRWKNSARAAQFPANEISDQGLEKCGPTRILGIVIVRTDMETNETD